MAQNVMVRQKGRRWLWFIPEKVLPFGGSREKPNKMSDGYKGAPAARQKQQQQEIFKGISCCCCLG